MLEPQVNCAPKLFSGRMAKINQNNSHRFMAQLLLQNNLTHKKYCVKIYLGNLAFLTSSLKDLLYTSCILIYLLKLK